MIVAKLYGGLGNQMFQYAAGIALAKKLKTRLYLNLQWFEEVAANPGLTLRIYELDGFGIEPTSMNPYDKIASRLKPPEVFKESSLDFNPAFKDLSGNIILDGYWQSYKYFESYRDIVLGAFKFPDRISKQNRELLDDISRSESVSVHVRRGDYNTKVGRNYHGLIPMGYYKQALSKIGPAIKNPSLFIFSDDIEWCKKNIKFGLPITFIDSNGPNSGVEDMRLMSACKHNIIANSSFSWWAAWLNQNPQKKVFAPKRWFVSIEANLDDRAPKDWRII